MRELKNALCTLIAEDIKSASAGDIVALAGIKIILQVTHCVIQNPILLEPMEFPIR